MRLFQNSRYYPSLRTKIRELTRSHAGFAAKIRAFLDFREAAAHTLLPVEEAAEWAFFTNGDDLELQRVWAREHGLGPRASAADILKAQIEEHRADVFYNVDATGWNREFVRSLPGCVKTTIAWHAAPFRDAPLADYDRVVCNFPSILERLVQQGCRTDYFFPAYDPELEPFAARRERPIDVLFVGGYSRHHLKRAAVLEAVARLAGEFDIVYHLDRSRLTRLAESPLGRLLPLAEHRRPSPIRAITREPVFGRDYYDMIAQAKIVLNGAIDMAGADRGNMRCFEALGGGALLLSDQGNYPEGMTAGETIVTYGSPQEAVERIRGLLADPEARERTARAGHAMVSTRYSKQIQWQRFEALVASI
ncbi:MAG: glycosyltransferase [Bradyrhizobium sp.]|uniref:glycosyltransferase family protein n=1 Tax=Bradyrhizobium sp. TaxID=376 RepID=UPI001DFA6A94|nr:glycosyltransferase [Bradyrhizobium sp.]MBV9564984.1 glycosyltransferase [Bradyrhizobium sp.]